MRSAILRSFRRFWRRWSELLLIVKADTVVLEHGVAQDVQFVQMAERSYRIKKRLSVSECRQHLPLVVDRLPAQGVVITKRGRPVAKLIPLGSGTVDNRPLFGALAGVLRVQGDIFGTGDRWNAES